MIWHFLEVWALMIATFFVGCFIGAYLYAAIASTRLATAQGYVADHVGDGLDRLKARLGLGPAWRAGHLRQMERPLATPVPATPLAERPTEVLLDYAVVEEANTLPARKEPELLPPNEDTPQLPAPTPEPEQPRVTRRVRQRTPKSEVVPASPAPVPAAVETGEDRVASKRPAGVSTPRGGVPDNLQRIKGIGKRNEVRLNELGIFHFGQIAAWTPAEVRWIADYLELVDRIERDGWVAQAIILAMGTETGFEKSAERRRQRRRQQREFQARMASATVPEPDILPPRPLDEERVPPPDFAAAVAEAIALESPEDILDDEAGELTEAEYEADPDPDTETIGEGAVIEGDDFLDEDDFVDGDDPLGEDEADRDR